MPSFKALAADASPATNPAATRAVVPYRTFFITEIPLLSVVPKCLSLAFDSQTRAAPRQRIQTPQRRFPAIPVLRIFAGGTGFVVCVAIETYE